MALRVADWLGRSRGRLRLVDSFFPPAPAPLKPDLQKWADWDFGAVWLGHATVLLRVDGMTILTDPVFSNRIGVGLGLCTGGPRRLAAAALGAKQLPPVDLILISHAHFDHLDRPSLAKLPTKTPVITAARTGDLVRDMGFRRVRELRWGEAANLGPLTITAQEVAHWGARTFHDRHRGFNAYLLETTRRRVLYGGDTAYHEGFAPLRGRGIDLGIFGIGAYNPYEAAHATPEQVWRMADQVGADRILPMHHSTFRLSFEPVAEPMQRLLTVAGRDTDRVVVRQIGGHWFERN